MTKLDNLINNETGFFPYIVFQEMIPPIIDNLTPFFEAKGRCKNQNLILTGFEKAFLAVSECKSAQVAKKSVGPLPNLPSALFATLNYVRDPRMNTQNVYSRVK